MAVEVAVAVLGLNSNLTSTVEMIEPVCETIISVVLLVLYWINVPRK